MFGEGSPFGADDLPPGLLRSQFDSLPPQAKARARHWLESFAFPEQDLGSIHLDEEGGVFYVDSTIIGSAPGASQAAQDPAAQLEEISASELFALHSKPGASHVVHLDFDGHTIAGTRWNSEAGVDHLYALPYDTNGNTASFSAAELNDMAAIWHRVAEDFAPFNIDVTTEAPAGGYGPNVGHVLITHRYDSNGSAIYPSSAGGVAYVGVWGRSDYSEYQPALVFYNHLGGGDVHNVAEASSHELGHNLNLSHDGSDSTNYYTGHGSGNTGWAPIMGVGYYKNVTQWSEGEYSGANNTQNDISIITDYLGLSPDDHGDELSAATALAVQADGSVVVTDPESDPDNASPANKGIIEHRNDSDYFYFDTTGGDVNLSVRPAWQAWDYESYRGADLDARAFLYDAYGNLIDQYDSASDTQVSIGASLVEGRYFVRVSGHSSSHYSDYGSLGQYFISGSIAGGSTGSANLISNAGFESDFQSWVDWGNSFIETGSVHSGARSARIGPSAGGRAQRLSNLVAGKQYTLCAWSRVDSLESPASSYMGVDIYAADDTRLANNQWNVAWTTWQQNSLTFTYPSNADYVNVWVWSEDASGATYVDDFDLVEGAVCEGTGGNAAPGANFSVALSTMTATFTDTSADSDGVMSTISTPWAMTSCMKAAVAGKNIPGSRIPGSPPDLTAATC